jgi:hypothetical protein
VAGVDPAEDAGVDVELAEHRRDEALAAEHRVQRLVDRRAAGGEVEARPAGVAVAGHREVGEQAGLQPVPDRVEDATWAMLPLSA